MSTTLKRTSMALDAESLGTLENLSKKWAVSKAEVLRRSLKIAQEDSDSNPRRSPLEALQYLKTHGGIGKEAAENYNKEVQAERKAWGESNK